LACDPTTPGSDLKRKLILGYLQVGAVANGICRYGRMLAAEARRRSDIEVLEENIVLSGCLQADYARLRRAALPFSSTDLVHIQVAISGDTTWGKNARALWTLAVFRLHCRTPLAITLHDVNNLPSIGSHSRSMSLRLALTELLKGPLRPVNRLSRQLRDRHVRLGSLFRPIWDFTQAIPFLTARCVSRHARGLFVLTDMEHHVLASMKLGGHSS
jgi:hypothetical protein